MEYILYLYKFLVSMRFEHSQVDEILYGSRKNAYFALFLAYVDDTLIFSQKGKIGNMIVTLFADSYKKNLREFMVYWACRQ